MQISSKILTRAVAIFLWWFVVVFILAINADNISWLAEGTHWGEALLRRPYAWDFELMFTVLFVVWGVFLWRAGAKIEENKTLIQFSAWALVTHAATLV